ncbi:unnamed protein product [Lampetra planeri]
MSASYFVAHKLLQQVGIAADISAKSLQVAQPHGHLSFVSRDFLCQRAFDNFACPQSGARARAAGERCECDPDQDVCLAGVTALVGPPARHVREALSGGPCRAASGRPTGRGDGEVPRFVPCLYCCCCCRLVLIVLVVVILSNIVDNSSRS